MTTYIDINILQNVAPGCLNRDDVGAPKTAMFGGTRRARISSQCLKRAQRKAFAQMGLLDEEDLGTRTNRIVSHIETALAERGLEDTREAITAALNLAGLKVKEKKAKADGSDGGVQTDYLLFLGNTAISELIEVIAGHREALASGKAPASLKKAVQGCIGANSVDVAMFGRMIADDKELSTEAAIQVAHSLSTHAVQRESDFFTAVDDLAPADEAVSRMLGSVEFNSACHYRFASINFDLLVANLNDDRDLALKGVRAYIRAAVMAIPTGKQNTFAAHNLPEFVAIGVHNSQPISLANAFQRSVGAGELRDGLVHASVQRLEEHAGTLCSAYGLELGLRALDLTGAWTGESAANLDALVESVIAELS